MTNLHIKGFFVIATLILLGCAIHKIENKYDNIHSFRVVEIKDSVSKFTVKTHWQPKKSNQKTLAFINRFKAVAIAEQEKFGIPASITLAQGILESSKGNSSLCKRSNNFFGITTNGKEYCAYKSAWHCFRAHSLLLAKDSRYKPLKGLKYEKYAEGLMSAGYCEEKDYANQLIAIIRDYDLAEFDTNNIKK